MAYLQGYLGDDSVSVFTPYPDPVETLPMPIPTELYPVVDAGYGLILIGLALYFLSGRKKK